MTCNEKAKSHKFKVMPPKKSVSNLILHSWEGERILRHVTPNTHSSNTVPPIYEGLGEKGIPKLIRMEIEIASTHLIVYSLPGIVGAIREDQL